MTETKSATDQKQTRIFRLIQRLTDRYLRGIEWDGLHETDSECINCGAKMYSVLPEYPEESTHLRCKECGQTGYGGRPNMHDKAQLQGTRQSTQTEHRTMTEPESVTDDEQTDDQEGSV